jgi:hypothetical protein
MKRVGFRLVMFLVATAVTPLLSTVALSADGQDVQALLRDPAEQDRLRADRDRGREDQERAAAIRSSASSGREPSSSFRRLPPIAPRAPTRRSTGRRMRSRS